MLNLQIPPDLLVSKDFLLATGAVIGATIAGIMAFISSALTSKNQLKIAKLNVEKDIRLLQERSADEFRKSELSVKRDSLCKILTTIQTTTQYYTSGSNYRDIASKLSPADLRKRFEEHTSRIREFAALAAIHFPELLDQITEIQNQIHNVWLAQESLFAIKADKATEKWQNQLIEVQKNIESLAPVVNSFEAKIVELGRKLSTSRQ